MSQPALSRSEVRHGKLRFTTAAKLFLVLMGVGLTALFIALVLALMDVF